MNQGQSPCDHVISHIIEVDLSRFGCKLPFYIAIMLRVHSSPIHSRPEVSKWKVRRPASVINISLHGGWNDTWCDLGI